MYHSLLLTLVKNFLLHFKTLVNQHIKKKNLKQIESCFGCVKQSKAFIIIIILTYVTNFLLILFVLYCICVHVCIYYALCSFIIFYNFSIYFILSLYFI